MPARKHLYYSAIPINDCNTMPLLNYAATWHLWIRSGIISLNNHFNDISNACMDTFNHHDHLMSCDLTVPTIKESSLLPSDLSQLRKLTIDPRWANIPQVWDGVSYCLYNLHYPSHKWKSPMESFGAFHREEPPHFFGSKGVIKIDIYRRGAFESQIPVKMTGQTWWLSSALVKKPEDAKK